MHVNYPIVFSGEGIEIQRDSVTGTLIIKDEHSTATIELNKAHENPGFGFIVRGQIQPEVRPAGVLVWIVRPWK